MTLIFAVFALGVAVSLVVAKGMMQANEFAKHEMRKLNDLDKNEENGE